jgi:hypothetical protein
VRRGKNKNLFHNEEAFVSYSAGRNQLFFVVEEVFIIARLVLACVLLFLKRLGAAQSKKYVFFRL